MDDLPEGTACSLAQRKAHRLAEQVHFWGLAPCQAAHVLDAGSVPEKELACRVGRGVGWAQHRASLGVTQAQQPSQSPKGPCEHWRSIPRAEAFQRDPRTTMGSSAERLGQVASRGWPQGKESATPKAEKLDGSFWWPRKDARGARQAVVPSHVPGVTGSQGVPEHSPHLGVPGM